MLLKRDPSESHWEVLASRLKQMFTTGVVSVVKKSEAHREEMLRIKTCEGHSFRIPMRFTQFLRLELALISKTLGLDDLEALSLLLEKMRGPFGTAHTVVSVIYGALRAHWNQRVRKLPADLLDSLFFESIWNWLPYCWDDRWIAVFKFQANWLFCTAESQELPQRVPWIHKDGRLLAGILGKMIHQFSRGQRPRNIAWRWTILQGMKKGLPQMSDDGVTRAAVSHQERLTRTRISDPRILASVYQMAKETIGSVKESDWASYSDHDWFSDNASLEAPYGKGPLGELIAEAIRCHWKKESERSERVQEIDLSGMEDLLGSQDFAQARKEIVPDHWEQEASYYWALATEPVDLYRMTERRNRGGFETLSYYLPGWAKEIPHLCNSIVDRVKTGDFPQGECRVKFILEPLKVRPITAGDLESNGIYKKLQHFLWSRLRRNEQFRLIGEPISVDLLRGLWYKTLGFYPALLNSDFSLNQVFDFPFTSGDFSAATDQLHGDLTEVCIRAVAEDDVTYQVLKRGLTKNVIHYDRDPMIDPTLFTSLGCEETAQMSNGQLMGCVFSFIFLCIINAGVYRAALEDYLRETIPLRRLPVLMNGDDIGFWSPEGFHQFWCSYCLRSGLEPSIGKNFLSKEFITLNSCLFRIGEEWERSEQGYFRDPDDTIGDWSRRTFEVVPYLNMSFMTGISKGGSDQDRVVSQEERNYSAAVKAVRKREVTVADFLCSTYRSKSDSSTRKLWRALYLKPKPPNHDLGRMGFGVSSLAIAAGVEYVEEGWFNPQRWDGPIPGGSWNHARRVVNEYKAVIAEFRVQELRKTGLPLDSSVGGLGLVDDDPSQIRSGRGIFLNKLPRGGMVIEEEFAALAAPWKIVKKDDSFNLLHEVNAQYCRIRRGTKPHGQFLQALSRVRSRLLDYIRKPAPRLYWLSRRELDSHDQIGSIPPVLAS